MPSVTYTHKHTYIFSYMYKITVPCLNKVMLMSIKKLYIIKTQNQK